MGGVAAPGREEIRTRACTDLGARVSDRMNKSFSRHGFTLVELMVVLVIISLLVGLLFSIIGAVRGAAARTQCTSNLKQLALALEKARDDHGDYPAQLPVRDSEVLVCPSDRTKDRPHDGSYTSYDYVRADPSPFVRREAEDRGILLLCRHHSRDRALIVYEGGAVKWQRLPDFLKR